MTEFNLNLGRIKMKKSNFSISGSQWVRVIGLIIICSGLSTFASAAQSFEVKSSQQVSEHWRGAYDILVRPQNAISQVEMESGLVEGNYLGNPGGGITLEQYHTIQAIDNVEVAAPVAAIGYMHNKTGNIFINLPIQKGTLFHYSTSLLDGNGALLNQVNGLFYSPSASEGPGINMIYPLKDLVCSQGVDASCFVDLADLPVLWTLVVGIDPAEEEKLIQLSSAIISGSMIQGNEPLKEVLVDPPSTQKAIEIPILISRQSFTHQGLTVKLESIPLESEDALSVFHDVHSSADAEAAMQRFEKTLQPGGSKTLIDRQIQLNEVIQPMSGNAIQFSSDGSYVSGAAGFFSSVNMDLLLSPVPIQYTKYSGAIPEPEKLTFQVSRLGNWGTLVLPRINELAKWSQSDNPMEVPADAPQYRTFQVIKPNPFTFKVVGSYDFDKISTDIDPLSYVPLGIYAVPGATLKYDENGKRIPDQVIYPDLNPGGFIQRPPLALTNLEAAQYILGSDKVINAIRVRVAGIGEYSPENVARVEKVASEIVERTGLHVDIVAGSSPQKVFVFVPGKGFVEEQWTSLGAAVKISSGINQINIFLYSFLLLSSILFVSNESQLMVLARRKEIGLLKAVGWHDGAIGERFLVELSKLGLLGAVISAVFSILLILALGLRPEWWSIALSSLILPVLYTLSSLPLIRRSVRISPVVALNQQDIEEVPGTISWLDSGSSLASLVLGSFLRRKGRTLLTSLITAIAAALAVIFLYSILFLRKTLQITLLGEAVSFGLRSFHLILAISVITLGLLVVLESLLISVMERRSEFFLLKALGWYDRDISTLVRMESVFLCGAGGLIGGILGVVICFTLVSQGGFAPWQLGLVVFAGYLIIGVVISIYPAWVANQSLTSTTPASSVEMEKSEARKFKDLARKPYFYFAIGLSILLIIGIGGRKQVVQSVLGMDRTPVPTLTSFEKSIDGNKMVQHIDKLSSLGPRFYANQAERDAANSIASVLAEYGLKVERKPVPLKAMQIVDPDGKLVNQFPTASSVVQGIAVDFHKSIPFSSNPVKIVFKGVKDPWPAPEEVIGKALIVENLRETAIEIPMQEILQKYKSAGYPFAFAAVFRFGNDLDRQALTQSGNQAILGVSEAVTGFLPGKDNSRKQNWITARYDSSPENVGADDGLSGLATMLEIARVLSANNPDSPYRFIALPGTYTGLVGGMAYLYDYPLEEKQVRMVIDLNRLGKWDQLVVESSFAEPSPWNDLTPEYQKKYRTEGQFQLRQNWQSYINLSQPDPLASFADFSRVPLGKGESPDSLIQGMIHSGQALNVEILPGSSGCSGYFSTFLSQDLPAIALCGMGNDLADTVYDDKSNIDKGNLQKAAGILYDFILTQLEMEQ